MLDPNLSECKLKVHWASFHVPSESLRVALEPIEKVEKIIRNKCKEEGFGGIETMTRTARPKPKEGIAVKASPHQLRLCHESFFVNSNVNLHVYTKGNTRCT